MDAMGEIGFTIGAANAMDSQTFGAQVVSKTLDYMNSDTQFGSSQNADYDFQKSVLSAAYTGKGGFANLMV